MVHNTTVVSVKLTVFAYQLVTDLHTKDDHAGDYSTQNNEFAA